MGCSLRSVYYLVTVRESEGKVKFEMLRFWRILLLVRESFKGSGVDPEPDPERIRNGTAFLKMARSGSGTEPHKKKSGSTTLVLIQLFFLLIEQ